jgi:hypothetical protein
MKQENYFRKLENIFKKENVFRIDRSRFMIVFSGEVYMFIKIGKLKDDDILKGLSKKHFSPVECWYYKKRGNRIVKDVVPMGKF